MKTKDKTEQEFLGYTIVNTGNSDGFVPFLNNGKGHLYQTHLGNFSTIEKAQKAVLFDYMLSRPEKFAAILSAKFIYGGGLHREGVNLIASVEADGLKMPKEITFSDDANKTILINGEDFGAPSYYNKKMTKVENKSFKKGQIVCIDTDLFLVISAGVEKVVVRQLSNSLTPTNGNNFRLPLECVELSKRHANYTLKIDGITS